MVSHCVRYFADSPVSLKTIGTALKSIDPQFKIDGGELTRATELLGEIEINSVGSDLFHEELAMWTHALQRVANPAAGQTAARLQGVQSIVMLTVMNGERDPGVTWDLLTPLWTVLPSISNGLTQVDGQGFYAGSQLIVQM
ncbi:MAG TPA: hypothetical protein VLB44_13970 [Kofleriaceae bacterium]|nr:hypothetical protein [Kofleriaceae bacterium]